VDTTGFIGIDDITGFGDGITDAWEGF